MRKIHHAIDNIEFGVTDMAATQAFYKSAFGWRFNNYGPEYAGCAGLPGAHQGLWSCRAQARRYSSGILSDQAICQGLI
jgi:predicted enzyme related to lactoylglutathione lyase